MYLYIVTCPYYYQYNMYKLGCTTEPHGRLTTYLTGCPPEPQYEIQYYGLWETNAKNMKDLLYYEKVLHDKFRTFRMSTSEWFQFEKEYIQEIGNYLNSARFVKRIVKLEDIKRPKKSILSVNKYSRNTEYFIEDNQLKNEVLDSIQKDVIEQLVTFLQSKEVAGQLIAPCGSGKTNMTCKAIQDLKRVVICVPSLRIQEQWIKTVRRRCLCLGGDADDWNIIEKSLKQDEFCIVSTYMSCKHLLEILPTTTELVVFDEAHHMAGYVSNDKEKGEGITRVLLNSLVEKQLKRLFLTFTPKDADVEEDMNVFSMNDEQVFGNVIAEVKLRELINRGVLPDYVIWALSSEGTGLYGKIEQILLAWDSKEINHLIIFVEDLNDKDEVKNYLKSKVDCPVLSVDRPQDTKRVIEEFNGERAILIDCKRLGEGVDIPIADSVAILYPKESVIDIVQMVLRAGRWFEYKSIFHILLPHTNDEDMSGIHTVLYSLAKYDEALRGEVLLSSTSKKQEDTEQESKGQGEISNGRVQYDLISSTDIEKMNECFRSIRAKLVPKSNKKEIQKLCIQHNVRTSKEYENLQKEFIHLPDDPRFNGSTWFDFLNPNVEKISIQEFGKVVIENNKRLPSEYTEWHTQIGYPSLQHIRDGYFGEDKLNFLEIIEKFAPIERRRR